MEDRPWVVAKRGINLLLNDKNKEAERLFVSSPPGIQITAGLCFVTFMNALMCFDDRKVSEAIAKIKKIEEQCVTQIGWVKSFKNKLFYTQGNNDHKSLEQTLEEKIVLADALVCQSFLTFLHNDFASYMKGGWALRRAWKVYQHTYEQLIAIHKHKFGNSTIPGWSTNTLNNITSDNTPVDEVGHPLDAEGSSSPTLEMDEEDQENVPKNNQCMYSCVSKTFSDFSSLKSPSSVSVLSKRSNEESSSSVPPMVRPQVLRPRLSVSSVQHEPRNMRKSISLFASLNSFSSAILESASSLISFNKESSQEWDSIEPETITRLMSAVSFGYGVFRLCVSLAPPGILRWVNLLGFEGDQSIAIKSLHYSRKGTDMRAPLASLALLWYHTIVKPFFNVDGVTTANGIEEANKILSEEIEYSDSALFLFFKGRVERLKPNISGAIEAYQMSVSKASLPEMKLLGLHEVGWCYLLTLDFKQAYKCFHQLKKQSKWSRSFYAYLSTICVGAMGNSDMIPQGRVEIKHYLEKSANKNAQIEKYIHRRMEKLPEAINLKEEWTNDTLHWRLYCYEMLYLWNTLPSCTMPDLLDIVKSCTPVNGNATLLNEPMKGIGWLINGAAFVALANNKNKSTDDNHIHPDNSAAYLINAVEAFRMCLQVRSKCSDDAHISAFAQYELALLLLRKESTRPEGKLLLVKLQTQYVDYDFEHRLHLRVNATLRSLEKFELENK